MNKSKTPMTQKSACRIQRAIAKNNGGVVPKNNFAGRAQAAAARNTSSGKTKK